jgi:hypothetical protein
VHFAWELPADPVRGLKARVQRITYELGPIGAATAPGRTDDGRAVREQVVGADGDPVLVTTSYRGCTSRTPSPTSASTGVAGLSVAQPWEPIAFVPWD